MCITFFLLQNTHKAHTQKTNTHTQRERREREERERGGILIWHKDNLKHLIKIVKIENASIWLEVKSVISQHNLYLCALYIPPHDSPYYNEQSFLQLQTDILHFQSRGQVLICGDLNARTGREIDYVNIVDNNHISNDTTFHSSLVITPRNSYDS